MRRVCAVALAIACAAMLYAMPAEASKANPTRIQVSAKEFFFALSRRVVPPGPAIVELVNFGEDPHDLRVQRIGGGRVWGSPVVFPGSYYDLNVNLVPGKYLLWCSIANHRQLGMETELTVKVRKKS